MDRNAKSSEGTYRGGAQGRVQTNLRGLYQNNTWMCDCRPRLPAEYFQVKNNGKNHGRWFYTCQKPQHKRCQFFLWQEDATPRERETLLGKTRSESNVTASISRQPMPISETGRMKKPVTGSDNDDAEGQQDKAEAKTKSLLPPETPRKSAKTAEASSPGKRVRPPSPLEVGGLRTPNTGKRPDDELDPFSARSAGPGTTGMQSLATGKSTTVSSSVASGTGRFKDGFDLSEETSLSASVLDILKIHNVTLNEITRDEVKKVLIRQEMKTQGIAKGRDISRVAIKAKEAKIIELQSRITALEAEKELDKEIIGYLRRELNQHQK